MKSLINRNSLTNDSLLLRISGNLSAYVRPSRQLLEFYRKKIAEYGNDHEALIKKIAELKNSYQDSHQLEYEMKQREGEIGELQKALSDMQVFLFKEREQVLNLYGENDSFKVSERFLISSFYIISSAWCFSIYINM